MRSYLIPRPAGPMQAQEQPTSEGAQPTGRFLTRNGLLGLLGACLEIQRDDTSLSQVLSESVQFVVRCDELIPDDRRVSVTGLHDYHTVLGAREDYRGLKSHETVQTWCEYLCDASFTIALWLTSHAAMAISEPGKAVLKSRYTPYLGRRSCPLTHPLFLGTCQVPDPQKALLNYEPVGGDTYSEESVTRHHLKFMAHDEPIIASPR